VPTASDHLVQAGANRAHAEWLLSERPNDRTALQWAVTAVFYSALHGLTAYLMLRGITVSSHLARERVLTNPANGVPQDVYDAYHTLDDQSRDARYELVPFTLQDVRDLLDHELAAIAAFTGM
jgi:hypothetical protein